VRDVIELQAMKALYCEIADGSVKDTPKAARQFRELFALELSADYGLGLLKGCDAVIDFLVTAIASTNDSLWHSIHSPQIHVNGDTAAGRWTVMVRMRPKGSTTTNVLIGRYQDEFRRTSEGWKFSSIRFVAED
jgi:hypothetical protein